MQTVIIICKYESLGWSNVMSNVMSDVMSDVMSYVTACRTLGAQQDISRVQGCSKLRENKLS